MQMKGQKKATKQRLGFDQSESLPRVKARANGHPATELPVYEQPTQVHSRQRPTEQEAPPAASWTAWVGAALDGLADLIRRNPRRAAKQVVASIVLALLAGYVIGLVVFGWWLWPVEWTGANVGSLPIEEQERYVTAVAELYSYDGNEWRARFYLAGWNGDLVACRLAGKADDFPTRARFENLAFAVNGEGCASYGGGDGG